MVDSRALWVCLLLTGCAVAPDPASPSVSAGARPTETPHSPSGGVSEAAEPEDAAVAKVVWIDDGDTVDVRIPGLGRRRVRLIGINSPESNPESTECGGPEATAALRRRVPLGSDVTLRRDARQGRFDRYGRLLRYVGLGRTDLGRWQVRHGHAVVVDYFDRGFERLADYRSAQERASAAGRGLWGSCPEP